MVHRNPFADNPDPRPLGTLELTCPGPCAVRSLVITLNAGFQAHVDLDMQCPACGEALVPHSLTT